MRKWIPAIALLLVGCGSKEMTTAPAQADPLAGMTPDKQIEALRNDHRLNTMERETKIAEIKKKNGIP